MTKLTATHSWSGLYNFIRLFFNEGIRIQDGCQCYSIISPIKMMLCCWMINHHKTTGIVKKCHNKQFLSLVWVFMADDIVNNEPLVMHDSHGAFLNCHLLIGECYGHKAVEYGVKYNVILVSQTIFIDKYSCSPCILRTLLKNHIPLTNVIVFGRFENMYLEQCSPRPILEWHSTTFLTFQHHLKISSTTWYFYGTTL